jgi:nucleoside-diphosphate-sugar epimerase
MKVVVTGGSGQLGSLVLERLVSQRKIKKVVSLDLVPPIVPSPRIDWRIADLRDPGLERHLEGADALVHLAFIVAGPASAETMRAVNVDGSRRIFEAAAQHGVRRIIYTSSVAAYGIVPELPSPVREDSPRYRSKVLTYAENKYDVEAFLDGFEAEHPEIAVVRMRPGILLGRRIAHVSRRFLARRVLPVVSDKRLPVVWDEDVADGLVLALMGTTRGAYNFVATDSLTGIDMARLSGFRARRIPDAVLGAAMKTSGLMSLLGEKRIDVGWIQSSRDDRELGKGEGRPRLEAPLSDQRRRRNRLRTERAWTHGPPHRALSVHGSAVGSARAQAERNAARRREHEDENSPRSDGAARRRLRARSRRGQHRAHARGS